VVGGLGEDKMYKLMPVIIQTTERSVIATHAKDRYIRMSIYTPVYYPSSPTSYL